MSYWQRVAAQAYISEQAIEGLTIFAKDNIHAALLDCMAWAKGATDVYLDHVVRATERLAAELKEETPLDPEGPNDPPLHAVDSWRFKVENFNGGLQVSVSNPKHYMQFLEAYGGVHDSRGEPGGPDPGWIAAAFARYELDLRSH